VYRRYYEESYNRIWIWCVSEKTNPESQPGWVRGIVILGGMLIEAVDANRCKATLIWSFDINKKLSVRCKDEEPKKVALRLCKIKKKIEDEARVQALAQEYEATKSKVTNI